MKNILLIIALSTLFLDTYAQIGIKADGLAPIPSAQLEVQSTNKAFYSPRMTTFEKRAIASPQVGAIVYDNDLKCLSTYDGLKWNCITNKKNSDRTPGDYTISKITSNSIIEAYDMQIDAIGSIYITGRSFGGSTSIYNLDGSLATTILNNNSSGGNNAFVLKFNSSGMLIWSARLSGGTGNGTMGYSLATDNQGVTVMGYLAGPTTVYNGKLTGSSTETSWGTMNNLYLNEGFVIKYSGSGSVLWTARFVGGVMGGKVVSPSNSNSVFVYFNQDTNFTTGGYSNTIYNGRVNGFNTETAWGGQTSNPTFGEINTIVKYNKSTGAVEWVNKIEGGGGGIAVSNNDLYVSYHATNPTIRSATSVAPNTPVVWGSITGSGGTDSYLQKMDVATGTITWVARQGGSSSEKAGGLCLDYSGNPYIVNYFGYLQNTAPVNLYQSRTISSATETNWGSTYFVGTGGTFITKYDANGNVQYANSILGSVAGKNIIVNLDGEVVISGTCQGGALTMYNSKSVGTDSQPLLKYFYIPNSGFTPTIYQGFIAKFNSSGKPKWVDATNHPNGANNCSINSIAFSPLLSGIYGCGFSNDFIQLGSENIALPTGSPQGFYFKYQE